MAEFRHVKRVIVSLWGHRVGMIVPTGMRGESYAFQYDRISDKDLLEVADRFAIGTAERVLEDVKSVVVKT